MLLKINSDNPNIRKVQIVIETLRNGGVIAFPTDTVYAFGCDVRNKEAIEKMIRIKGIKEKEVHFSLICTDLSEISDYTAQLDRATFKMLKRNLPGPYTFILKANKDVTKMFDFNKKTIGVRIPQNNIARDIVKALGNPLISTSIHHDDEILDYITDPEEIFELYKHDLDIVVDGGIGDNLPSTVIDYSGEIPQVMREGKGILEL